MRQDVEQHSMENILTDTRQLNKDNNLLKMELENRIQDLATQNKTGGDNKASKQYNYSTVSIEPKIFDQSKNYVLIKSFFIVKSSSKRKASRVL